MMGRDCGSILDVGGSGGSILNFIQHPNLCVLDIDKTALMSSDKRTNKIVADGCRIIPPINPDTVTPPPYRILSGDDMAFVGDPPGYVFMR